MASVESFDVVAFRSRQHALYFSQILKDYGISNQLMSTPKEIMLGCGLSVRFSPYKTSRVIDLYRRNQKPIIGFYHIDREGNRYKLTRIPHDNPIRQNI